MKDPSTVVGGFRLFCVQQKKKVNLDEGEYRSQKVGPRRIESQSLNPICTRTFSAFKKNAGHADYTPVRLF